MFHKIIMLIVMAFALGVVGCRSCLAPYDLCQPTFVPENGDQCMGELYRSGSVLGGADRQRDSSGDCRSCSGEITDDSAYYLNAKTQPNAADSGTVIDDPSGYADDYNASNRYQTTAPSPYYGTDYSPNEADYSNGANVPLYSDDFSLQE